MDQDAKKTPTISEKRELLEKKELRAKDFVHCDKLLLSPEGRRLLLQSDKKISLWDLSDDQLCTSYYETDYYYDDELGWSDSQKRAYKAYQKGLSDHFAQPISRMVSPSKIIDSALADNGIQCATTHDDGSVLLWDLSTEAPVTRHSSVHEQSLVNNVLATNDAIIFADGKRKLQVSTNAQESLK
jgi:WD40 repeat protein